MEYDPQRHHRRTIRLKGYDYSQAGSYFITICTQDRRCLFGNVVDGIMNLNDAGNMVKKWWLELGNRFNIIKLDEYIIMPNHIHGIIMIKFVGADLYVCPIIEKGKHIGLPLHRGIQWFKTMTINEYICGVKQNIYKPFDKRLWQRNYYEHIIRNEKEFYRIKEYILNNPLKWELDRENPLSLNFNQEHQLYWKEVYDRKQ